MYVVGSPRAILIGTLGLAALLLWWAFRPAEVVDVADQYPTEQTEIQGQLQIAESERVPTITTKSVESFDSAEQRHQLVPADLRDLHTASDISSYEQELLMVIDLLKQGDLESALAQVDTHLASFPKSCVGHLLRADIFASLSQGALASQVLPAASGEFDLDGLRKQLRNRWLHTQSDSASTVHSLVPSVLIDFGRSEHVLVADMTAGRLFVYRKRGQAKLVSDYYLSVGSEGFGKRLEGDNKTPVGVYVVNRFIHPDTLPDLYGSGAFPVDYPNKLDRAKQRTGYGIWLHGTPSNTYARSPWASEGCFVVSNEDFEHIQQFVNVDQQTPVVLAEQIEWITPDELIEARAEYLALIEDWRQSWEALDTQRYLDFYAQEQFNFGRGGYDRWAKQKVNVNRGKTFVQVQLDLRGVFRYPGEKDMFVAHFTQRYLSNNYSGETNKQQYWQRDNNGRWRIVFEG